MSERDEIKDKLDKRGVEYDGRLSTEKLAEILEEDKATDPQGDQQGDAQNAPQAGAAEVPDAPTESTITCRVMRDYWTDDGRVRAGAIEDFSVQDALDGVASGALQQVKG